MIHLAALQVPFCRADPPLGARVNVLGTVNVFEAAKAPADRIAPIVYASSIAAFDANGTTAAAWRHPGTIYGVYKRANESTAAVYLAENGISSIGLRPHTVYGVGRDQGVTSAPTTAMLAAAAGVAVHDPVRRRAPAPARARRRAGVHRREPRRHDGAAVHNLPGRRVIGEEIVATRSAPDSHRLRRRAACRSRRRSTARSFAGSFPGFAETPLADGVAADDRPLPRPPRRGPRPATSDQGA